MCKKAASNYVKWMLRILDYSNHVMTVLYDNTNSYIMKVLKKTRLFKNVINCPL